MELGPTFNRGTKLQTSNNMNDLNTWNFRCDTIAGRTHEGVFCPKSAPSGSMHQ